MAALPVAFVHSSATEERLLAMPTSAADAARRLRKIMGGGAKESAFVTAAGLNKDGEDGDGTANGTDKDIEDSTAPPPPAPETPTAEQVAALDVRERMVSDPLAGVSFTLPPDALPPPPPRAASSVVPKVKRRFPTTIIAPPNIFSGAVEEDEDEDVDMQKQDGEGVGEEDGDWAEFAEEEAVAIAAAAELEEDVKPVKPPDISPEDLIQSLQLVEVWRAEVKGDTVIKAGGHGLVRRRLAPLSIYKAKFKLTSPPQSKILGGRFSSEAVDACLLLSKINPELTIVHYLNDNGNEEGSSNRGPESGEFSARLQGTPMECTYLTYTMPASVCPPPLTAQLLVVQGDSGGRERAWRGAVVVRYAVGSDTALPKGLLDLVIDVDMAPDAGGDIVKCSPAAEWCPNQCRLRWNVGKVEAGGSGEVKVVMSAGKTATAERATVALKERTTAKVSYSARPGKTLSGVGFEVGLPEADIGFMGGQVVHVGEMLLSL